MKKLSYLEGVLLVVLHQIDNFAIAAFPLGVGIASCVVSYLGVKSLNITMQLRRQLVQKYTKWDRSQLVVDLGSTAHCAKVTDAQQNGTAGR